MSHLIILATKVTRKNGKKELECENSIKDCYLDFLRYCLDDALPLPESSNKIDWKKMMIWAERQSIVGIIFHGIKKVGKSLKIPTENLIKWIGNANLIEGQNRLLNNRCVELTDYLKQYGFDTCILKGQGNALMYPNPLLRTPGDIDVWTRGKGIRGIIRIVRKKNPKAKACYHHVDYGKFKDVEVEIHYRPSFMFNPIHNWRLQKWFSKMAEGGWLMAELPEDAGSIRIPNREFNIIFQLSHIYNHVLHEGIGLKQIIDYYYLLIHNSQCIIHNWEETLRYLGLEKIAGAMMWVLVYLVYGEGCMVHGSKRDDWMICEPDEKRGKVLLAEIMKGGNFGHYDAENQKANNAVKKNILRIKRDIRMMWYFPSECLWEPFFRLYHWGWRLAH